MMSSLILQGYAVAGPGKTGRDSNEARRRNGGRSGAWNHAAFFSAATLSVASQLNSGSERPKWP
jgi:hypothetical protein